MPKTTKFVDSRVSKAVRSLKDDEPSFITMPASQDGMRKTMSSVNINAIVEKCIGCCKSSVKIHEICSSHQAEPLASIKNMLSDKFEKAVISRQPITIISNNKKLEQYLAERVDKWLSEMALDKSLQDQLEALDTKFASRMAYLKHLMVPYNQ